MDWSGNAESFKGTLLELSKLRDRIETMVYSCAIFFILVIQVILNYIFVYLEHRKMSFQRMETVYLVIMAGQLIWIFINFVRASNVEVQDYMRMSTMYSEDVGFLDLYMRDTDGYIVQHALLMAILWVGFLLTFRIGEQLGKILKIFASMIKDIVMFLIIYILILMSFACVGNLLFMQIEGVYDTFPASFITLYSATLGDFNFTDFEQFETQKEIYGKCYLALFLMANMILALNLLIALLSTTYSEISERAKAIYCAGIIQERPIYKYSKHYGSMVSACFPYTIVCCLFYPLLSSKKHRETINNYILHLAFLPILLLQSALLICIFILLMPFTYLKVIIHKAYLINNKIDKKTSKLLGTFSFLFYLLFGLLLGVYQIFIDIIKNVKHIYTIDEQLVLLYEKIDKYEEITPKLVRTFINLLGRYKEVGQLPVDALLTDIKLFGNYEQAIEKDFGFLGTLFRKPHHSRQGTVDIEDAGAHAGYKISLAEMAEFEEFIIANSVNNIVYPRALYQLFYSSIQIKQLRKIINEGKIIVQIGEDKEREKILDDSRIYNLAGCIENDENLVRHREVALFRYFKLSEFMHALIAPEAPVHEPNNA